MARHKIVWRILTLHCDEASRLSSESLDHNLSGVDKAAWRLHLLICGDCRRHRRDILSLRQIARQATEPAHQPVTPLSEELRERIKRSMKGQNPTA